MAPQLGDAMLHHPDVLLHPRKQDRPFDAATRNRASASGSTSAASVPIAWARSGSRPGTGAVIEPSASRRRNPSGIGQPVARLPIGLPDTVARPLRRRTSSRNASTWPRGAPAVLEDRRQGPPGTARTGDRGSHPRSSSSGSSGRSCPFRPALTGKRRRGRCGDSPGVMVGWPPRGFAPEGRGTHGCTDRSVHSASSLGTVKAFAHG